MYLCRFGAEGSFDSCSAEEVICPALDDPSSSIEYRVDESYDYYLNNWYVQMDLVCTSKIRTNSMISFMYVAFGVAGILLFAMPDRRGRKFTMVLFYAIHLAAQYLILFYPDFWARLLGLVLYGVAQLKQSVVYVWATELAPSKNSTSVTVSLTCFDSGSLAFICIYFMFISKDWFPLMLFMTGLSTVAFLFMAFALPESPIWLINNGQTKEAVDVFNYIGKWNGVSKRLDHAVIFQEAPERENSDDTNDKEQSGLVNNRLSLVNPGAEASRMNLTVGNISKLVANNLSLIDAPNSNKNSKVNWCNMVKLILVFIGVCNCYWITIYNVSLRDGNKFVNGIVLGVAELFSGIVAGLIISFTSPSVTLYICALMAIGFNGLSTFVVPEGSILSYLTLAMERLGFGGTYTCVYVLIGLVVPAEQLGGAFVLIVTVGTAASLMAPMVTIFDSPIPFIVLACAMSLAALVTFLLPKEREDMTKEQEDHLMDGWHQQNEGSTLSPLAKFSKNKPKFQSGLMRL